MAKSSKSAKAEVAQVEGQNAEGQVTTATTVAERPAPAPLPVHAEAMKLSDHPGVRNALKGGFGALWRVKGLKGLFKFESGCKDTQENFPEGEVNKVVVQYPSGTNTGHAILVRDAGAEEAILDALNDK